MTAHALDTFPKLLDHNAQTRGARIAYREKEYGVWQQWTWAETREEIRSLAMGLMTMGAHPGDKIAIIGTNRPHLYWSMVAAQCCGCTPCPLYQDGVAEEMVYVLDHCEARFAIVEDQEQVDKLLSILDRLPKLEHILYSDKRGLRNYDHSHLHHIPDVQETGRRREGDLEPEIDKITAAQTGADICAMLYTSGTTGKPKGVVLSNDNIVVTSRASVKFDDLAEDERTLAYLPMAWVGDFIFSMGQAYVAGFSVSCPESADTMMTDLREIGPTYFFAPPRIFETLLTTVMIRMQDAGWLKKKLFDHFIGFARETGPKILDGEKVGALSKLWYQVGRIFIYGPLRDTLGMRNVRVGYTAGEAIGPEIFAFYRALGVNLKQLYGQTEASVFITQQPDGQVRDDTVGVPSPGVEVKIGENGEVYYRSPGVFVEYYKNPESTADTKDSEGWVATGDAGFFEEGSGHLRIIDRAKDVGKLSTGALFAPKYVENKLKFYPEILEAVVFGDGRDHAVAFLNIDMGAVGSWAERNNISYASYQELAGHPEVYAMMRKHVETVNESLADDPMMGHCQVHRFLVLHKELDADDGEMTRTRKVRRRIINERYDDLITALYDGSERIKTVTEVTYEDGRKGSIAGDLQISDAKTFPVAQSGEKAA